MGRTEGGRSVHNPLDEWREAVGGRNPNTREEGGAGEREGDEDRNEVSIWDIYKYMDRYPRGKRAAQPPPTSRTWARKLSTRPGPPDRLGEEGQDQLLKNKNPSPWSFIPLSSSFLPSIDAWDPCKFMKTSECCCSHTL